VFSCKQGFRVVLMPEGKDLQHQEFKIKYGICGQSVLFVCLFLICGVG